MTSSGTCDRRQESALPDAHAVTICTPIILPRMLSNGSGHTLRVRASHLLFMYYPPNSTRRKSSAEEWGKGEAIVSVMTNYNTEEGEEKSSGKAVGWDGFVSQRRMRI
ncbi:hypothetical protein GGI05_004253 [Coemansia sp. RSA 2603]|nr:hypothetical protein GGI05_004253 [Coemansia sp. RSA 2603]